MVVRVLASQDCGPGGTAECGGDECVVEGNALIGHVPREGRYLRHRRSVKVIRNYEDDVGTAHCFYGPPLQLSRQEEPERQACPGQQQDPAYPAYDAGRHDVVLPVEVILVTEPDQELPGLLFEDAPVLLGEVVLPVTRYPLAVERRRGFLALGPAARELLEARGLHTPAGDLLIRVGSQELQQPHDLTDRLREEVLVAYLIVVVAKERRILHRPTHGRTPAPCYLGYVFAGEDALPRGYEGLRVLTVGFTLCNLLTRELTATALVGRIIPLVVNRGHSHVPAVPDYVHDLCTRADGGNLLYHARGGERALVPDDLLVRLPELLLHEVVYGVGHDVFEIRVVNPKGPGVVAQPPL